MLSPNTFFLATNWHDVGHEWGMTCSFQITTSPKFGISPSGLGFLITDSYTTENRCLCCLSPTQLPVPTSKLLIFGMQMHSPSLIWNLKMMVYKRNLRNLLFLLVPFSGETCEKRWEGTPIFGTHSWLQLFPTKEPGRLAFWKGLRHQRCKSHPSCHQKKRAAKYELLGEPGG